MLAPALLFAFGVLTPEVEVDEPVVVDGPEGAQAPAVATDGLDYVVVWTDGQYGLLTSVRVQADGTVGDSNVITAGMPISTRIGYDGVGYAIVWTAWDGAGPHVRAARLGPTGALVDGPQEIDAELAYAMHCDAAGCLMIARQAEQSHALIAPPGGSFGAPIEVPLPYASAIARAGDGYVAVAGATAWRLDASGAPLDPSGTALPVDGGGPYETAAGDGAGVVTTNGLNLVRLDLDGDLVSVSSLAPAGYPLKYPILRARETGYLLLARSHVEFELRTCLITSAGDLEAPCVDVAPGFPTDWGTGPRFAVGTGGALIVDKDDQIYALPLSLDGTAAAPSPVRLSYRSNVQSYPAAAAGPGGFLLAFNDNRSGDSRVYARRIGSSGVPLGPAPFQLSLSSGKDVTVASLGGTYVVTLGENVAARVDGDGSVTYVDLYGSLLASDGAGYLLVGGESDGSLWTQALAPDLTPIAAPATLAMAGGQVRVSADPGRYLVTWAHEGSIDAALLGSTGLLGASFAPIISTGSSPLEMYGACHGERCLIVWSSYGSTPNDEIFVARATTTGAVLDPTGVVVAEGAGDKIAYGLVHDGSSFLLLWSEGGTGFAAFVERLRLARLDEEGTIVSGPVDVVADTLGTYRATLATDGAGHTLIAYPRIATELAERSPRLRVRVLDAPAPAGPDAGAQDAAPGDGGLPDGAAADPDAAVIPPEADGCACRVSGGRRPTGNALLALFALAALRRRRR